MSSSNLWGTINSDGHSLASLLEDEFNAFFGVPDSEIGSWVDDLLYRFRLARCFCVVREDVAISCAFGHVLAGGRPLVFMGMQGLAASFDALTSLITPAGIPLVLLASHPGPEGLPPHKEVLASGLIQALDAFGIGHDRLTEPARVELAKALIGAQELAEASGGVRVVLVRKGAK